MIKSRNTRWEGHIVCMGEMKNTYKILTGKPEGKKPVGGSRRIWEDNIRMESSETGWETVDWIHMAQYRI
jgi:hypothetical protein